MRTGRWYLESEDRAPLARRGRQELADLQVGGKRSQVTLQLLNRRTQ